MWDRTVTVGSAGSTHVLSNLRMVTRLIILQNRSPPPDGELAGLLLQSLLFSQL